MTPVGAHCPAYDTSRPRRPGLKAGAQGNKAAKADFNSVPKGLMRTQPGPLAPGGPEDPFTTIRASRPFVAGTTGALQCAHTEDRHDHGA
jgi:hypothetical protein